MSYGYKRKRMIGSVIALIVLMVVFSSISGAFYGAAGVGSNTSSHVYVVTETINGQKYSYYEEVKNGNVVKTWPAPSAPSSPSVGIASDLLPTGTSLKSGNSNSQVTISPSSSSLDIGQYQVFTAGSKSNNWDYYHWQLGDSSGPSSNVLGWDQSFNFTTSSYNPTVNAPGTYYLWVTAGNWYPQVSTSAYAVISISASVSLSLFASSSSINVGQSVTFTNTTLGGIPSYRYSWSYLPSSGVVRNGNTFAFSAAGIYNVTLTATDSIGGTASNSSTITVGALPSISPSPSSLIVGQYQVFTESSVLQIWD